MEVIYSWILFITENNAVRETDPGAEGGSGSGQSAEETTAGGTRTAAGRGETEDAPGTRVRSQSIYTLDYPSHLKSTLFFLWFIKKFKIWSD